MSEKPRSEPNEEVLPDLARKSLAFAQRYHQFEVFGDENIPAQGPGLVVAYHGLLPLDGVFFVMHHYLKTGRVIRGLTDRHLYPMPGFNWFFRTMGVIPGRPEDAVQLLRDGHLVGVFPGGVREAVAGEKAKYQLQWDRRLGFARVALETNVPIIPAFTENADEMYKAPGAGGALMRLLYEKTRLPIVLPMGLGLLPFPVRLRTWIGPPVHPIPGDTPESLAARAKLALETLIRDHQTPNQTLIKAIRERLFGG